MPLAMCHSRPWPRFSPRLRKSEKARRSLVGLFRLSRGDLGRLLLVIEDLGRLLLGDAVDAAAAGKDRASINQDNLSVGVGRL
jgi:hypothetical protein